jgi:hypothetical protein
MTKEAAAKYLARVLIPLRHQYRQNDAGGMDGVVMDGVGSHERGMIGV